MHANITQENNLTHTK